MQATTPNYYDDAGEAPAPKPDAGGEPTTMINKSVLNGREVKPGDEITLKVVGDHGSELEVSCCCEGGKEKPEGDENPEAPSENEGGDDGGGMRSMLED